MPGTVYFHIGSPKTGTSAIQVALVRNRELLEKHGLIYPETSSDALARQGLITSGNGALLAGFLWPEESPGPNAAATFARLEKLMNSRPGLSLIYSAERFEFCPAERFSGLCARIEQNGARVKIIYYVRHLMDLALSAYNQAVKRAGYHVDFSIWLKRYKCRHADVIRTFSNIVGPDNLIVRLYEDEEDHLVKGFFRIIFDQEGIPAETIDFEETPIVNRSLTRRELDVLLFVNKLVHDRRTARRISTKISDRIVGSLSFCPSDYMVTPEELRTLEDNSPAVPAFVNEFVGGIFELKFKSDKIAIGARQVMELDECDAKYRPAIAALIAHVNADGSDADLKSKLESDYFMSYRDASKPAEGRDALYHTLIGALIDYISENDGRKQPNASAARVRAPRISSR